MAVRMVTVVLSNGRKARVPETYPPLVAGLVRLAPSELARITEPVEPESAEPESGEHARVTEPATPTDSRSPVTGEGIPGADPTSGEAAQLTQE